MKKIELEIVTLSHSLAQTQNYAIVLGEKNGPRRLPIVIGGFEAQAIAVAMEAIHPSRPMTHDLFKNTLNKFDIDIKEIIISNLVDGVFYATLVCIQNGKETMVDSRTSDALALAVRFNATICTYDFILEQAGIVLEEDDVQREQTAQSAKKEQKRERTPRREKSLEDYSVPELEKLLAKVLSTEDYEKAAKIRDELSRRSAS